MPLLEVDHLTKDYGSGRGVFDVSFSVGKGEVYGFLGPNGAGKSTTIRHLMGFSKPDSGECRMFGRDCFTHYSENLKHLGYIPGEIALPQGLTGKSFFSMMEEMERCKGTPRLKELEDYFELDEESLRQPTKRMSLGIKRKIAVITAFLNDPDILILDEPTSGLDPLMQERFIAYVRNEKERGKTILLSSHIFSEVDATCDRIGIIKDGHLVSEFEADDLRHSDRKTYRIHFRDRASYERFRDTHKADKPFKITDCHDYSNVIFVNCLDENVNALVKDLATYKVASFSSSRESLQDFFMKFYKEDRDFGGAL